MIYPNVSCHSLEESYGVQSYLPLCLETLEKIRKRISSQDHWCQKESARDEEGKGTDPNGQRAVQWCLSGAITKESWDTHIVLNRESLILVDIWDRCSGFVHDVISLQSSRLYGKSLVNVNDELGHKDVLLVLESAKNEINLLVKEGGNS